MNLAPVAFLLALLPLNAAIAQGAGQGAQSGGEDQLTRILGKDKKGEGKGQPVAPSPQSTPSGEITLPIFLRAGQSLLLKTGASTFQAAKGAAPTFKVLSEPGCGQARAGSEGIVLVAKTECVGQRLEFAYEVSAPEGAAATPPVKVNVRASVTKGIESCGISNAPFNFVSIPAGTYSLKDIPARLADVASLAGKSEVAVAQFCIAEEAVPASEMAEFLSSRSFNELRRTFPEALATAEPPRIEIETGRELRAPAVAVSHKMANGYAATLALAAGRPARLPTLDEYVAAAAFLERNAPNEATTHSFAISLRGGLIEWTSSPCASSQGTFATIGRQRLGGDLETLCFEPEQRLGRMGFRLVMEQSK